MGLADAGLGIRSGPYPGLAAELSDLRLGKLGLTSSISAHSQNQYAKPEGVLRVGSLGATKMRRFFRMLRRAAKAVGAGKILYQCWSLICIIRELFL